MRNKFLKFVPSVLILIALALLFVPKKITYLSVEKFFADTRAYYCRADKDSLGKNEIRREDYYYPGVAIGKLWKKIGIGKMLSQERAKGVALRDEYLFGCNYAGYNACVLPYPAVKEYALNDYRVLRVSSQSSRFPDYQYLFFKDLQGSWVYAGHIDVFDNKRTEPVFRLLDNGLASVIALAGEGDGYSTKFMQVYAMDGREPKLLLAVPSQASRKGLGLLNFNIDSTFDYKNGVLVGNYQISFSAEQAAGVDRAKVFPLFTVARHMALSWDGRELRQDPLHSEIAPVEVSRIVSGSYARIYMMFKEDFDKLRKADGIKKDWFNDFMDIVKEQGVIDDYRVLPLKVPAP